MKNKSKSLAPGISLVLSADGAGSCFFLKGNNAKLFWINIKTFLQNFYNLVFIKAFVFSGGIKNITSRKCRC